MAQESTSRSTRGRTSAKATEQTADQAAATDETGTEHGETVAAGAVQGPGVTAETITSDQAEPVADETDGGNSSDGDQDASGYRYLNVSGGPLHYDEDGHVVGDGEWTPPVHLDTIGRHYRDVGHLQSSTALGLT